MVIDRIFLIVLDSFGIGALPDAARYGDEGSNTLAAVAKSKQLFIPNLHELGLFNIESVRADIPVPHPTGCYGRLAERSAGKDTTTGHWEIAGLVSPKPMPTYPQGFPKGIIAEFERRTGRKTLCNRPYSGTQLLADFGEEHMRTGKLIVYTSADSVFQVAAHEEVVPLEELYRDCEIARGILTGEHAVGRVIARPFRGQFPDFVRTEGRHDYSLVPPRETVLDLLKARGLDVIGVGKIHDIFAGRGITKSTRTRDNNDGMRRTIEWANRSFRGLCFVNLVDFDMLYGHRNDRDGYAAALSRFDRDLDALMPCLKDTDLLIITADHGCDPSTPSTDHSREYVPLLLYSPQIAKGVDLGTRGSFADIAATIAGIFQADPAKALDGESFLDLIEKQGKGSCNG